VTELKDTLLSRQAISMIVGLDSREGFCDGVLGVKHIQYCNALHLLGIVLCLCMPRLIVTFLPNHQEISCLLATLLMLDSIRGAHFLHSALRE
jgi:hypothetical protein